jgi:hypothetical protein
MWDLFISYATEDRDSVAKRLVQALEEAGLSVGAGLALDLGDSLNEMIEKGLQSASYGAVLLTPAFFAKGWTRFDLDSLTREVVERNTILPIWHGITPEQAARHVPRLASQTPVMIDTDDQNMEETARQVSALVQPQRFTKGMGMGLEMMQKAPTRSEPTSLYRRLVGNFSLPELHDIASRFQVDEPSVESKPELARQMVTTLDRRGRLRELGEFVDWLRPQTGY